MASLDSIMPPSTLCSASTSCGGVRSNDSPGPSGWPEDPPNSTPICASDTVLRAPLGSVRTVEHTFAWTTDRPRQTPRPGGVPDPGLGNLMRGAAPPATPSANHICKPVQPPVDDR